MLIVLFAVFLGWLPSNGRGETREAFGVAWACWTAGWLGASDLCRR